MAFPGYLKAGKIPVDNYRCITPVFAAGKIHKTLTHQAITSNNFTEN
jgi:hypothetical protein